MTDFRTILPAHIAIAMAAVTPREAVERMLEPSGHRPVYSIDIDDATWSATSLAIRHGLLMELLAAEVAESVA